MSIITPKMVNNRSADSPGSCVFFMPFTEGSGTTYSDVVGDISVADDNAGGWTTNAHCAEAKVSGAADSGTFPTIPAGKSIIFITVDIIGVGGSALSNTSIGAVSQDAYGVSNTGGFSVNTGLTTAITAAYTAGANGEKQIRVGTYNGATGLLSSYSAVDGAALAADNTTDGSTLVGIAIDPTTDNFLIGSSINDSYAYGVALYIVDTLPSDAVLIEAGNWVYKNWTNGVKGLPPQLATY